LGRIDAHLPATASYIDDDDDCSHLIYSVLAGGQKFITHIQQLKQGKNHVGGAFLDYANHLHSSGRIMSTDGHSST
jgi:hypothetical protein